MMPRWRGRTAYGHCLHERGHMTLQIARLTQALVLALTAPDGRETDADDLAQQLAHGMAPADIAEGQRQALAILDGVPA